MWTNSERSDTGTPAGWNPGVKSQRLCNFRAHAFGPQRQGVGDKRNRGPGAFYRAVAHIMAVRSLAAPEEPMIITRADLSRFELAPEACWVQDVAHSRITWANAAAVQALRAPDLAALLERDIPPRSE